MSGSSWSVAARNAALNAKRALFNDGYLRYYDGERPAGTDAPVTTQRILAELRFAPEAFREAMNGVLVANGIRPDPDARASGQPTWYRCFMADGVTPVHDGGVAAAGAEGTFLPAMIIARAVVECPEFVITEASE